MPDEYTPDISLLTQRERTIIWLLLDGKTLAEIAAILGITREWVARQLRNAQRKLGATTDPQWQAVLQAVDDAEPDRGPRGLLGES